LRLYPVQVLYLSVDAFYLGNSDEIKFSQVYNIPA